jgi:hypothetical protein
MLEIIIPLVVLLVVIVGLWWTRGAGGGGLPGGIDDPAREELAKYSARGARLPEAGAEEPENREHQVE